MSDCPFCKNDMYHYEHNGIGYVPVAINCCDAMCALNKGDKKAKQLLRFKSINSHKKYKRVKKLREHFSIQ